VDEWNYDAFGKSVLLVRKTRGKINMDELADHLRCDYRSAGVAGILPALREK
jgi:hypothetical protein